MLTGLFMLWTLFIIWKRGFRSHAVGFPLYVEARNSQSIPKIAPFLAIIFGVMYVLYGGVATPSEAAGVGAALCVVIAVVIYRMWRAAAMVGDPARHDARVGDDPDDHRRRRAVRLHADVALPDADAGAGDRRHARQQLGADGLINVFLLVCGFFIPPAAIILMTAPILYPIIKAAGFDPVWFGVILTINMEIGLIHPPVGLNIYIVSRSRPTCRSRRVMWGTIPYVGCMMLAIVILCMFPEIATWLPDHMMGARH